MRSKNITDYAFVILSQTTIPILIAFAFLALLPVAAHAATYYVDGSVATTGDGSEGSPFKTIQEGVDVAGAGDSVNIKGSVVYTDTTACTFGVLPAAVCITSSGSSGDPITIQAWPGTGIPVIEISGSVEGIVTDAFGSHQDSIVVKGLKVVGDGDSKGISIKGDEIQLQSSILQGAYVYIGGDSSMIQNTLIESTATTSLVLGDAAGGNMVAAYHNVIDGGETGISANGGGDIIVKNNIIVNTTSVALGYNAGASGIVYDYDYNLLFDNASNYAVAGTTGANDITGADPLFTDPDNGDYTLQHSVAATSPAINTGVDLMEVSTDIDGRARVSDYHDIGAYESPDFYVDGADGSDSGLGTAVDPFLTIHKAAGIVGPGYTINVKGEITYTTSTCSTGMVCPAQSGTADYPIIYQNWPGTGVPYVHSPTKCNGFNLTNKSYIQVSGFDIDTDYAACTPAGVRLDGASNITVTNNVIHDSFYGIDGYTMTADPEILIANNTLYNNRYENVRYGIISGTGDTVEIKNNILVNSTEEYGISTWVATVSPNIDHNILWNNSAGNYSEHAVPGENDIVAAPQFIDAVGGDYRLSSTSPGIDAGATFATVTTDILGVARPQGSAYDIGAYEYYAPTISLDEFISPTGDSTPTVSGDASTPSGTISSIEYSIDSGSWITTGLTADDGTIDEASEGFTATLSELADGSHTIVFRVTDSNGYTEETSKTFTVGAVGPYGHVIINGGASTTSSLSASLYIGAADDALSVAEMMLSESPLFAGASWETYSVSKNYTFSSGNGLKTVYVKFKNEAGVESMYYYSDSILYQPSNTTTDENEEYLVLQRISEQNGLLLTPASFADSTYTTTDTTPTFEGTARANATVEVTVTNSTGEQVASCTATASSGGNWSCTLSSSLVLATYQVSVAVSDSEGLIASLPAFNLQIVATTGNDDASADQDVAVSDDLDTEVESTDNSWILLLCVGAIVISLVLLLIIGTRSLAGEKSTDYEGKFS